MIDHSFAEEKRRIRMLFGKESGVNANLSADDQRREEVVNQIFGDEEFQENYTLNIADDPDSQSQKPERNDKEGQANTKKKSAGDVDGKRPKEREGDRQGGSSGFRQGPQGGASGPQNSGRQKGGQGSNGPEAERDGDGGSGKGQGTGAGEARKNAGLDKANPQRFNWYQELKELFPKADVDVLQQGLMNKVGIEALLDKAEVLDKIEPNVELAVKLLEFQRGMNPQTRATARRVVEKIAQELMQKIKGHTESTIKGAVNRAARSLRPRNVDDLDLIRTLDRNLHNVDRETEQIVLETLIGTGRKQTRLYDIVVCVDDSGSMCNSKLYSAIYGAAMCSLRAVNTRLVLFSDSVVDVSSIGADPVGVLFSSTLGGGTNIYEALSYCQQITTRPDKTVMILITDLYDYDFRKTLQKARELVDSKVNLICLTALNNEGAPEYNPAAAQELANIGVPTFNCKPDLFPDLIAAAIERKDLGQWAKAQRFQVAGL